MMHNMDISTYCYNTDVMAMVLAVMVAKTLPAKDEVWIAFGTEKNSDTWQPIKLATLNLASKLLFANLCLG